MEVFTTSVLFFNLKIKILSCFFIFFKKIFIFNEYKISPNPSNGDFFIAGPALTSITLYNQFGQKVNVTFSTIGEGKYQVMTAQLANGSYILELQNEGAIVRKSIKIIQ